MKANTFQKCLGIVLLFASLLFLTSPVDARPHLRVGVPVTDAAQGAFASAATDEAQAITQYAGYEAVFVPGSWDACREALATGAVDVVISVQAGAPGTDGMMLSRLPVGWQRGAFTASSPAAPRVQPMYFAVRAGNDGLLRTLDDAADRLMMNRPGFLSSLERLYAEHGRGFGLNLTEKEEEYLRLHPVIPVVVVAREQPFAYIDEFGALQGTLRMFTDRIQQDLGVQLRVIPVQDFAAAAEELESGRAQVLLDVGWDPAWAQEQRLMLTAPFNVSNYTAVTRREAPTENPIVAAVDNRMTARVLKGRYSDDQIRIYPGVDECLKAVETRGADITFVRQETAQYHILQGGFSDLQTDGTVAFSLEMAAGVSMDAAPMELLTILDKEIAFIGPEAVTNVALRSDTQANGDRSLMTLAYAHPQYVMLAVLTLFMLVVIFMMNSITMRRTHVRDMVRLLDEDQATHMKNRAWFQRQVKARLAAVQARGAGAKGKSAKAKDAENAAGADAKAKADDARALQDSLRAVVLIGVQRTDIFISTYGRDKLMEFLRQMAEVLESSVWTECVATHGSVGEVILLTHTTDLAELKKNLKETFKLHEFANVGGIVVRVPLAAGIAPIAPPLAPNEAIQRADFALHEAQDILVFDDAMLARAHLTSRMESLQEQALKREEFEVWYQPKYNLNTHKCTGAEALVRWRSEELGFLPPGKFIPLFERNGFISQLDFYNLEHVMRFQQDCRAKGLPIVPISVNQSRVHMQEQGYLAKMRDLVMKYSTDGVALELTETAFDFTGAAQREHSIAVIAALHGLGFRIDMDDFGSGYSDLSLLSYLPLDTMKIDRSLLLASEGSARMRAVLQKMVELGHTLGMIVICEGIETRSQERLLIGCGCNYGQGFMYGKPMPRKEFEKFLVAHA